MRREKILALQPFCQEAAALSGGILSWPRPGVAGRASRDKEQVSRRRRASALRCDA